MSSLRRRTTGSSKKEHPHYLSSHIDARRQSTCPSFLSKASSLVNEEEEEENVESDVLYPQYRASKDDHVDIEAFNRMVQQHNRKLSSGTLQLSKTLSKQNQLYGPSRYTDIHILPSGTRFRIYSSKKDTHISTNLDQLLSEEGQNALRSVVNTKGWWLDVLCPTTEEMTIISKVCGCAEDMHMGVY